MSINLHDTIAHALDSSDYDQGKLEDLVDTVYNLRHALAALLVVLRDKGEISSGDITTICPGCFGLEDLKGNETIK